MAGWSQNRRGEWHLEVDAPSAEDAVDVRVLQDDGGYGYPSITATGWAPNAAFRGVIGRAYGSTLAPRP
jgi:hypothetical protein